MKKSPKPSRRNRSQHWRRAIGTGSLFGKYIHFYLVVAGISLVIDSVDVVRHLLGDGELYLRWAT